MKNYIQFNMAALSINLPDPIAKASNEVAKRIGISRTEFIRQAIIHELKIVESKFELEEMVKSFNSIKTSKKYHNEVIILENLDSELPLEENEWWNKKKR
jgi:metal-responsive CopG/Arc/MetJ family transcriptional regulator